MATSLVFLVACLVVGRWANVTNVDWPDLVMRTNFGQNWQHVMHDSASTNRPQFNRMEAVLMQNTNR